LRSNSLKYSVGDLALSPFGLFLKVISGKRVLAMAHGKDTSFNNPLYKFFIFNTAEKLDGIVCVSEFLKQELIKRDIPENRLFVNPNGINTKAYANPLDREEAARQVKPHLNINVENRQVLLSVSRMVRKKGLANFTDDIFPLLVKNNPDLMLLLVGEGGGAESHAEKKRIIDAIKRHNLERNVRFIGDISDRAVLRSIYSVSDIFVMPNRRIEEDFEGFGIVALEASMNEVPVVAFGVDGIPSAIKDGENGILIKEGDSEGFAGAVTGLLQDDDRRIELGKRARRFVTDHYDWNVICDRYIGIVKKVLA
jgi:phosphatidyl-myo-inositol dimannoside synthase